MMVSFGWIVTAFFARMDMKKIFDGWREDNVLIPT